MKSEKELKKEIRTLKKIKNKMRPHTDERIELHRQIQQLKENLDVIKESNVEKIPIINMIYVLDPLAKMIDLDKFTIEELQKHLNKLKGKLC